jgi:hypothetical protein
MAAPSIPFVLRTASSILVLHVLASAQITAPPTILMGTAPTGDVHGMPNNHNSLANLADGSVVALVYRQTSSTAGRRTPATGRTNGTRG